VSGDGFWGIWGRPFIDLEPYVDGDALAALDDELTLGLVDASTHPTGGSLKWMGVTSPRATADGYADYGHVIEAMTEDELRELCSLADEPRALLQRGLGDLRALRFGDETDHPLNDAQARFLAYRHRVYFPWDVSFHFLENERWEDKNSGEGKAWSEEAEELFPETVAFLKALPFREVGRCVLFGLRANQHAPLHRDAEPGKTETVGHAMSLCPRGDKRFYLASPDESRESIVATRAYWFNDMDWHGVLADPYFRYSIRVDGVFEPSFLRDLTRQNQRARRLPWPSPTKTPASICGRPSGLPNACERSRNPRCTTRCCRTRATRVTRRSLRSWGSRKGSSIPSSWRAAMAWARSSRCASRPDGLV
jgi:hypothetical protein